MKAGLARIPVSMDEAQAEHNTQPPCLAEFSLPVGTRGASLEHVYRAERVVVGLGQAEELRDTPRQYLIRLSYLMFVLAHMLKRLDGGMMSSGRASGGHAGKIRSASIRLALASISARERLVQTIVSDRGPTLRWKSERVARAV